MPNLGATEPRGINAYVGVSFGVTDLFGGDLKLISHPISVSGWRFGVNGDGAQNPHFGLSGAGLWVQSLAFLSLGNFTWPGVTQLKIPDSRGLQSA